MLDQPLWKARSNYRAYSAVTFLVAVAIFVIDTFTTLDIAIAVLYAVVVMVSAGFLNRSGLLTVSGLCMTMTVLSYLIVHAGSSETGPLVRALVSLCAIGITTILALKNQEATQHLINQAALLNATHDAIIVCDRAGIITYWNAGAEDLYGWKASEAIGQNALQLLKTEMPTSYENIHDVLSRTARWQGELVQTRRDGTQVTVASRWSRHRDERGQPVATITTNNDITEHKRAEDALHQARTELSHVARVTTLGELTASIAHEINQPLAAVVTNGEACLRWLMRPVPDLEEVRSSVERMMSNGRRASEVVARLRALARKSEQAQSRFTMNDVVDDIIPLVERELVQNGVRVRFDLEQSPLAVEGDRVQMQQVVINLVMNAIQAMAGVEDRPRRLTIRTANTNADPDRPAAIIEIKDTGLGIDAHVVGKLFMPFYTTKKDGMGMGLSICRSIVEAHNGAITAHPGEAHGAAFVVELPALAEGQP